MNRTRQLLISMLTLLCCCTGAWAESTSDVLNGVFTVSNSGKRVQFSKGNLQYVNDTYQFAEHQYDYSGNYQDWFAFNSYSAPSDGISWYVMSQAEWKYLFVTRTVTNTLSPGARYSKATIGGTYRGVIVFPDNYTHPDGTGFTGNCENATEAYSSTVSLEGWALMEAAGCVFLPAAGYSTESSQINQAAVYQSTTSEGNNNCYTPGFYVNYIAMEDVSRRSTGVPVRYVKQYELPQDADGYYLLSSVQDWKDFATLVNTTPTVNARMTADIDLGDDQTMIGSGSNNVMDGAGNVLFKGKFDGQGHTLTINYSNSETFVAPFRHIFGATIKNIHVKGSITGSGKWLGGIVAAVFGKNVYSYLEKCYSSVSITSTNSPSDNTEHIGGIVAQHGWESNLSLTDCVFDGSLRRASSKKTMSGLVGCYDGTIAISNSLHLGTLIDDSNTPSSRIATLSYRWSTHGDLNPVNCYYKNALGEAQGTQATAEELSNGTTASALQNGREEIIWVQDPITNQPMLKLFANAVTLTDGDDLTALSTHAGKTCQVTYSRSFTEGKSSTVCLPFAFAKGSVGTFYTFTGITKSGSEYIADMTEYTGANLVANTPYLFTPSATGSVDFSGTYEIPASLTAGSTTSGDWTYLGTYETIEWTTAPTGIYGFSAQAVTEQGISQGEFVKVGAYVRVKPMRCYLKYKNGAENYAGARAINRAADEELPETIKVRLIGANGDVMGIGSMSTKTGEVTLDNEAWYSLDGRRIEGKPTVPGIYVRSTSGRIQGKNNGKKVIIK